MADWSRKGKCLALQVEDNCTGLPLPGKLERGIERRDKKNLAERYYRLAATWSRTLDMSMRCPTVARNGSMASLAYPQGDRKVLVGGSRIVASGISGFSNFRIKFICRSLLSTEALFMNCTFYMSRISRSIELCYSAHSCSCGHRSLVFIRIYLRIIPSWTQSEPALTSWNGLAYLTIFSD